MRITTNNYKGKFNGVLIDICNSNSESITTEQRIRRGRGAMYATITRQSAHLSFIFTKPLTNRSDISNYLKR